MSVALRNKHYSFEEDILSPDVYSRDFFIFTRLEQQQRYTLGKQERLKSRKHIEHLFKEGKSFPIQPLRVYYTIAPLVIENTPLQFGVAVGTKHFKKAVDRNRVKRLIREAWRLQKNKLKEKLKEENKQLHVFFIFTGKEVPDYKLIAEKTELALQKLEQISVQSAS